MSHPDLAPTEPSFPPLWRGEPVPARLDPFEKALAAVMVEPEPGTLYWSQDHATMRGAMVLAPEMPLAEAMGAVFAVELGLADSLGALAPPEVAVHFVWPDRLTVNGALCGQVRAAASTADPRAEPDWLVIGVALPIRSSGGASGARPTATSLHDEGCIEITAPQLIESWSRHTLVWINRFIDDGLKPLHRAWNAKCDGLGETIAYPRPGLFLGLDERGGMLLRQDAGTELLPLTLMLEPSWPDSPA